MRLRTLVAVGFTLGVVAGPLRAQLVDSSRERVEFESPEGWAMAWTTASSLMTGAASRRDLAPGELSAGLELGSIPHLSEAQQRVGFGGLKDEDLNKSHVFGRLRLAWALPADWRLELGWTPPLKIDGARADALVSAAVERSLQLGERWRLSARVHGQRGAVRGDITCPRRLAGNPDRSINRYGCIEPSDDRLRMRYHAVETDLARVLQRGSELRVALGYARFEPEVQVNARSAGLISRPLLDTRGAAPYLSLVAAKPAGRHWQAGIEVLYVPLRVRRPQHPDTTEAFWSLRLHFSRRLSR